MTYARSRAARVRRPREGARRLALSSVAATLLSTTLARAEPSKEDVAKADALFREAQGLVQKGQISEGCVKFAESQKLDPANGTLLNLAVCHEKEGRYATAYRDLQELIGLLGTSKDDRERLKFANDRMKVVEKKLTRVAFDVSLLPTNAALVLDGDKIADVTSPIPIDQGTHTVEATAPQKKPGRKTFAVKEPGALTVKLDPLEDMPVAEAPVTPPKAAVTEPPPPPKPHFWNGQRVAGAIVSVVGLAGVGVGTYFGLDTFSKKSQRDQHCNGTVCDAVGITLHNQARTSATVSTIAVAAGGAALLGGVILFATASPKKSEVEAARPKTTFAISPTGAFVQGTF